MSKDKSTLDKLVEFFRSSPTPQPTQTESKPIHHKLSSTTSSSKDDAVISSELRERRTSTVKKEELEKLYHVDSITFRQVNKYVDSMIGPGFYFEARTGGKEALKVVEEWVDRVRLKRKLEEVIKDVLVTGSGNGWIELGYNKKGNDIPALRMINPKTNIDYIRDEESKMVILDKKGKSKGFVQEKNSFGDKVIWTEENITVGGKEVWVAKGNQDGRDRIAHFKLFGLGESFLGNTPLEAAYKDAIIRLNLTDNIGEMGFRGGAVIAYVGEEGQATAEIPDSDLEKLGADLENITHEDIFIFKRNVHVDNFPIPELKEREKLIYYFIDVQSAAMGIPMVLLLEPARSFKGEVEFKAMEFEKMIEALQEKLAEQVEDQLLSRLLKAKGYSADKTPKMIFRNFQPAMRLSRSRRIGKYVKDGVLHWDKELEKQIRLEEGLSIENIDKIVPEKKEPTIKDIDEKLNELVEKDEE